MDTLEWNRRHPVTERHVQALWYDAARRPTGLRTAEGALVRVVDAGEWNVEAGPDFRHAVLEVGEARRRVVGDVEIHMHPADWRAHGHGDNPSYANVIAHVTWFSAPQDPSEDGLPAGCLRICIGDRLRTRPDFSPYEIDLAAYPYAHLPATPRPCSELFSGDPDRLLEVLRQEGERRMEQKARRFAAVFVRTQDRAQAFYSETLAALGYKRNSQVFRLIAEQLPWRDLPLSRDAALASMLCAAGMAATRVEDWHRSGVRPANSPERRMASAVALFAGSFPDLLVRLDACDLLSRGGQRMACDILRRSGGIGMRRAAAILANVLVPFALAEGRIARPPDWLVPEETNSVVRLTAFRLLGRDHNPALYAGNGLYVQGLLQLHRDYCLSVHPDCGDCSLLGSNHSNHQQKGN